MPLPFPQLLAAATMATLVSFSPLPPTPPNSQLPLPQSTTTSTNLTNHRLQVSPIATIPPPLPSPPSPAPSPTSDNRLQISNEKTNNYAKDNPGAHELDATMATTVGHMATVLETNTPVPPAKTKPLATRMMPHVPTLWVAVRPTNPAPLDIKGGVYTPPILK